MAEWVSKEELDRTVDGVTVSTTFRDTVRESPNDVALRWREGSDWQQLTYGEFGDRAARVATGLSRLGVKRGSRIVLMMRNRPEFHVADIGALLTGATSISIYNSSAPEQVEYLTNHCEAEVAIVEDIGFLERFLKVRSELPNLRHIVMLEPDDTVNSDVLSWDELVGSDPVDLDTAAAIAQPEDLATMIYTSGTTGPPKGVMLSHYNIVWTVESYRRTIARDIAKRRVVSYLPMAHIAERMSSHYLGLGQAYQVTTCPEPGLIGDYLREVRPQIFFGVPRIWEKLHAGIQQAVLGSGTDKQAAFEGALAVGKQVAAARARGEDLSGDLAAKWEKAQPGVAFVSSLVGLDQVEVAVTGAAPISTEVLEFFLGIGVPLSEIYGMSESTGPMTWEPFRVRVGTVGPRMPGIDVKLLDDGEVVCRGGNVFQGYLKESEKTAETIDDDGWLHSGDIGQFDDEGYLKIVDRKKELIITAGGKNISPANIEGALKAFPLIGQAAAIGDKRPYMSALIVLDSEVAPAWAKSRGITAGTLAALAADPDVLAEIERNVAEANQRFNNTERIKRYTVLSEEWQPDSEELTPTMKLKRRGINEKYASEIEALYTK
jgi:long-chain acyl-CoA synthetase